MDTKQIAQLSLASQNKEELEALLNILKDNDIKVILEIGCDKGFSLAVWRSMFPKALILGIELRPEGLDHEVTKMDKRLHVIEGDSHTEKVKQGVKEVLNLYDLSDYGSIDFLFIDGDHHYESVKSDYERYSPLVRKGGIIALHDAVITDNDTVEVYKFWPEITEFKSYQVIHKGGTGVGVIEK